MLVKQIDILSALRGLAAWWVVFYHFRECLPVESDGFLDVFLGNGYLAVDFFFVLSGFVIYLNYGKLFSGVISKGMYYDFIARRISRIYPLYILMLFAFLANPFAIYFFSEAKDFGGRYSLDYLFSSIFLVQNWGFYKQLEWNIPAWSISAEFGAYLIFPFLAKFVIRYLDRLTLSFLFLIFIYVVTPLALSTLGFPTMSNGLAEVGLIRCLFEFSVGLMVCHIYLTTSTSIRQSLFFFLIVFVIACVNLIFGAADYFYVPEFFSAILYIFVVLNSFGQLRVPRLLLWLGEISYSTYLVHFFVKDWVKFFSDRTSIVEFSIYIFVIAVASPVLYYFVENPGRKFLYLTLKR